jgi:lipopolysaccharide biosynthesis regulator YciM
MAAILLAAGCSKPPQLATQECFDAVAQLRTAISAKDLEMVDRAEQRLEMLAAERELNGDARITLQSICDAARAEQWTDAYQRLDVFQKGQTPKTP